MSVSAAVYIEAQNLKKEGKIHESVAVLLRGKHTEITEPGLGRVVDGSPLRKDMLADLAKNPFRAVGVQGTSGSATIKKSYHKLALKYHPDKMRGAGGELFSVIQNGYQIVSGLKKQKISASPKKKAKTPQKKPKTPLKKAKTASAACNDENSNPNAPAQAWGAKKKSQAKPRTPEASSSADGRRRRYKKRSHASDNETKPQKVPPQQRVWYEHHDDSWNVYYINSVTDESTWELPKWLDHLDPDSGVVYYENTKTGASQWEQPFDFVPIVRESEEY